MKRKFLFITVALGTCLIQTSWAQQRDRDGFPSKPIQIIVPATPGGILDVTARLIANGLSRDLGQPVLVDYKAGAGQTIGANFVAKAAADGHTLLLGSNVSLAVNPQMMANLPYDAQKDLIPVAMLGTNANALMVLPSFPANNFKDFVSYVHANPGKVSYAHPNPGSSAHIAGEALRQQAKLDYLAVPFKGSAGATTAALGGQVDVLIDNMATALPLIKAGKLKALAVTSSKRSAFMPDIPSISEAGFPGFNIAGWVSIHAPANTPTPIVNKLNSAIQRALASPEVQQQFEKASIDPINIKPQEIQGYLKADYDRWGSVIRQGNIRSE
jgi:tripartite-type tricarboxylate transporter receptor subunit TctC